MRSFKLVLPAAATLLAASLFAHETWLAPNQGYIAPGLSVRLDLTSGGAFPILETAIEPARLASFGIRLGEETLKPAFAAGPRSLKFSLLPPKEKEGFATAFVSLGRANTATLLGRKELQTLNQLLLTSERKLGTPKACRGESGSSTRSTRPVSTPAMA